MRGSVWERYPGSWWYKFDLGRDADGKRQRVQRGGFKTKREAEQAKTEAMAKFHTGSYVPSSKQTLAAYLRDEWFPTVENSDIKESTIASYRMYIDKHLVPALGSIKLQSLTAARLSEYYTALSKNGKLHSEGGLAPKTIRNIHLMVKKALGDAVRTERLNRNPAQYAVLPGKKKDKAGNVEKVTEQNIWTAEELGTFLEGVRTQRFYPAVHLTANTGMRRSEVLGLRWSDVDLDRGVLHIQQTLLSVDYQLIFETPKSARSRRPVSLDRDTVSILKAHRLAQKEERLRLGVRAVETDLVFSTPEGKPIHPGHLSDAFKRWVRQAGKAHGLRRIRFHDLRHTHATIALRANVHPKVVQERLGHSSIQITLDTYSHLIPSMDADAAELIAGLIPKSPPQPGALEEGGPS